MIRHQKLLFRQLSPVSGASALIALLCTACTTLLTPQYVPHVKDRLGGTVSVGNVTYVPFERGEFDANQIDDSTVGNVILSEDIGDFVANALRSELRAAGVDVSAGADRTISAQVEHFKAGTAGFSVDWELSIRFQIRDATQVLLYDERFTSRSSHGKFTTFEVSNIPSTLVATCVSHFMEAPAVRDLLTRS